MVAVQKIAYYFAVCIQWECWGGGGLAKMCVCFRMGGGVIVHFKGGARARDGGAIAGLLLKVVVDFFWEGGNYSWVKVQRGHSSVERLSLSVAPLECPNSYCLRLKRIVFSERLCLFSRVFKNVKDLPEA